MRVDPPIAFDWAKDTAVIRCIGHHSPPRLRVVSDRNPVR